MAMGMSNEAVSQAARCCLDTVLPGTFLVRRECATHAGATGRLTADDVENLEALAADAWTAEAARRGLLLEALETKNAALRRHAPLLSHSTAAHLHGLLFALPAPPVVEVTHRRSNYSNHALRAHRWYVPDEDVVWLGERRVTSIPWTLGDLAVNSGLPLALPMADDALRRGVVSEEDLSGVFGRWPRSRHSSTVRTLVSLASSASESPGESLTKLRLHELGRWPDFAQQVEVTDAHGLIGRLDFADKANLLAIEFDGWHKYADYGNTVSDSFKREKRRDARLLRAGWTIRRVEWADVQDLARFRRAIT